MNIHKGTTPKWVIFRFLIFKMIILALSFGQSDYLNNFDPDSLRFKVLETKRCAQPPIIDGNLNDPVWEFSEPVNEFFQIAPKELSIPSEYTSALFRGNGIMIIHGIQYGMFRLRLMTAVGMQNSCFH